MQNHTRDLSCVYALSRRAYNAIHKGVRTHGLCTLLHAKQLRCMGTVQQTDCHLWRQLQVMMMMMIVSAHRCVYAQLSVVVPPATQVSSRMNRQKPNYAVPSAFVLNIAWQLGIILHSRIHHHQRAGPHQYSVFAWSFPQHLHVCISVQTHAYMHAWICTYTRKHT